jgi:hypothetical protein
MSAYALPGAFPLPPLSNLNRASQPRGLANTPSFSLGGNDWCVSDPEGTTYAAGDLSPNENCRQQSMLAIQVRNARLDPLKLIQALTTRTDCSSPGARKRLPSAGTQTMKRQRALNEQDGPLSVQEEAMQFELAITLDPNNKCAREATQIVLSRSLSQILALRSELLQELSEEESMIPPLGINNADSPVLTPVPRLSSDDYFWGTEDVNGCQAACNGGGFVLWQARLHSYAPRLETWLRDAARATAADRYCQLVSVSSTTSFDTADSHDDCFTSPITAMFHPEYSRNPGQPSSAERSLRWAWREFLSCGDSSNLFLAKADTQKLEVVAGGDFDSQLLQRNCAPSSCSASRLVSYDSRSSSLDRIEEAEKDDDDE